MERLELSRLAALEPKSSASTNFATSAQLTGPRLYGILFVLQTNMIMWFQAALFYGRAFCHAPYKKNNTPTQTKL